jgi:hypothetical protein
MQAISPDTADGVVTPRSSNARQLSNIVRTGEADLRANQAALMSARQAQALLVAGPQSVFSGGILRRFTALLLPVLCGLLLLLLLSQALLALNPEQPQKQLMASRKTT